jgi:hypothetical protein
MPLNIWTKPSGYILGTFPQEQSLDITLPMVGIINPIPLTGQNRSVRGPNVNMAFGIFGRIAPARYADNSYTILTGLPNPRTISNIVCYGEAAGPGTGDQSQLAALGGQSAFVYAWGQFITHEISSASPGTVDISITVPSNDSTFSIPGIATNCSISGIILTVGGTITGTFTRGQFLTGAGVVSGTEIEEQIDGVPGGAGTYAVSISQNVASASITASEYKAVLGTSSQASISNNILTLGGTITGNFYVGMTLTGPGVLTGTQISGYLSGSGGTGTYYVTVQGDTVNQAVGPIVIQAGDPALAGTVIPVKRTRIRTGTGANGILAQQMNETSGWIDGSVVYGIQFPPGSPQPQRVVFANPIDLIEGGANGTTGKLTSVTINGKQYPRLATDEYNFLLGDGRGQENPDLTSLHTLFLREHNYHAARIKTLHPNWTGRQIYERAKAYTVAIMQKITYDEWLPWVVGDGQMPDYQGFDPTVDPTIKLEFTGAALRFGHSIVSDGLVQHDEYGNQVSPAGLLKDMFFMRSDIFAQYQGADGYLRKLGGDISNKLDVYMVEDLRSMLFDPPAAHDLAATNIQRGRDLGLPTLNDMRRALNLAPYADFNQITSDTVVAANLQTAYGDVELIDLWLGGLAEDVPAGAPANQMVGETFQKIIIDEFTALRAGDKDWYQNQNWHPDDLAWIEKQTLSQVILRNTDTIRMQPNAMEFVERTDLYNPSAVSGVDYVTLAPVDYPAIDYSRVSFTVISGELPPGVYLIGNHLIGNPYVPEQTTQYTFCIRAKLGTEISDRTFNIIISGANIPEFLTPPGDLKIGTHEQMYALDQTYIDFQIEAFDLNPSANTSLHYTIFSGDGELPPGLTMDSKGHISGFILPTLKVTPADGKGTYDESIFDAVAYDFARDKPSNGYDDFDYDNEFFDFNLPDATPTTINRNYQFKVTVTDGTNFAQRIFRIFVVGDDQFKADSTTSDGFAGGLFTADSTYIRAPAWLTARNLGIYRANNYLTVPLALYNRDNVLFRLEATNREIYAESKFVSGNDNAIGSNHVTIKNTQGTPAIGQYFTFDNYVKNVTTATFSGYIIGVTLTIIKLESGTISVGQKVIGSTILEGTKIISGSGLVWTINVPQTVGSEKYPTNFVSGSGTEQLYQISNVSSIGTGAFRLTVVPNLEINVQDSVGFYIGTKSVLPTGTQFDQQTCEVYGSIPYQPAVTKLFNFTIVATRLGNHLETLSSAKTFSISVIGEIDSYIQWTTDSNLGSINANFTSILKVKATSSIPNAVVVYSLTSGSLPAGLNLSADGEITGKANQFYNALTSARGLITIDHETTTFDGRTTSFDRVYTFTVEARDQYGYSAVSKDFFVKVDTPNTLLYSNIRVKPFLKPNQRSLWKNFINDTTIFIPESIYRPNDPVFGVQSDLSMLVYAGIETERAGAYIGAMGLNHKRKRFQFGAISTAIALDPQTHEPVYEVIYVKMIDPRESNGKYLPQKLSNLSLGYKIIETDDSIDFWSNTNVSASADHPFTGRPEYSITVDGTGYKTSNPNTSEYYPNSITNWQKNLKSVGESERNYLPLWMRSIQPGTKEELGYIPAVPLCYCQVGTSASIANKIIKFSGFDFKLLDFTVDRYIIDAVADSNGQVIQGDKYLVFRNDRITV